MPSCLSSVENEMMDNGFGSLIRRKRVDAATQARQKLATQQLARKLSLFDLTAIGVGATIGAGVYILVGTVAREHTGPSLTISFFIGGIAAALSAFCYAELACRCPSAGSAYHYSYVCIGEGVAWLIGWALILEYTLGGAAVARGIAPNLASFFGGMDKLSSILARQTIFGIVVDPGAAILVFIITALLCTGIKESSLAQAIITTINISALVFIVLAGAYLGCKTGWPGYEVSSGYFAFGANGLLAGSATVFFSYIGFDIVASTTEEPRILMAMARDGLLPSFFSDISKHTQVPVKGTIATGIFIAILAFFMDVSQLAGMVSVGTLLSFTIVALSILILRYVPPDELPFLPSDQQSNVNGQHLDAHGADLLERPLLEQNVAQDKLRRRKIAVWSITMVCFGILVVVAAVSTKSLSSILRFILSGVAGMLVICFLAVLSSVDQADTNESFTKSGGLAEEKNWGEVHRQPISGSLFNHGLSSLILASLAPSEIIFDIHD
ncbi:cationic amino acid transporter 4, vacuolar-like isoform X6 [Nicotiana sylvestris]|uniref:cationic amino acid transporter 4, vacuolar-like isoform X6 n=1 Tax=Nicotiana sylvestris TaxID=4096 RepID=UPI00388CD783